MNQQESKSVRERAWADFREKLLSDETRAKEFEDQVLSFGDVKMRFAVFVIGEPGENGYPLYIALHGGGHSETPDMNDSQWEHMKIYYRESVKNGIYVAVRGVRDTWNTHANPESYPLYDRLISDLIVYKNVDPNRVYITGFSAGGDGVYLITPFMADTFAAANMSAGCPNGTDLSNLRNMPLSIQAGERDYFFRRNELIAEYEEHLENLSAKYGGYVHQANILFDKAHNYRDNDPEFTPRAVIADNKAWLRNGRRDYVLKDTNAISFVSKYVRDPYPECVVWDLSRRAELRTRESFYWLSAPCDVRDGRLVVSYSQKENKVVIREASAKRFSVYINEKMFPTLSPEIVIDDPRAELVDVDDDAEKIAAATAEMTADPYYVFTKRYDFVRE